VSSPDQPIKQELRLAGSDNIQVVTVEPWAADTPWWWHAADGSGGTPRMAAMDDPQKVVDKMIRFHYTPGGIDRRLKTQSGRKHNRPGSTTVAFRI
jgi:hypothetical protein